MFRGTAFFFGLPCLFLSLLVSTAAQTTASSNSPTAATPTASAELYMKVQLKTARKLKTLKTGDNVEGTLSEAVYSGAREVLPAGCQVQLTVNHFEKRKREKNDHWPWVVNAFTPRHENYPIFRSAKATLPDGKEVSLQVAFLTIAAEHQVNPKRPKTAKGAASASAAAPTGAAAATANAASATPSSTSPATSHEATPTQATAAQAHTTNVTPTPIVTLEATISSGAENLPGGAGSGPAIEHDTVTLEPGTQAKIILLDTVSASKSKPGDAIEARLIEPVKLNDAVVLPEGTLFEGRVLKASAPKMLSRPGSLLITFEDMKMLNGASGAMVASVSGAELDQKSHTQMNSEGQMSGGWPGKAWMFINLGVTAGLAKVSDDSLQLVIEMIVSTATDASTAGTARIFATCVSGIFLAMRHGRDVVLPKFTEMRITLNRPLTVPATTDSVVAPVVSRAVAPFGLRAGGFQGWCGALRHVFLLKKYTVTDDPFWYM